MKNVLKIKYKNINETNLTFNENIKKNSVCEDPVKFFEKRITWEYTHIFDIGEKKLGYFQVPKCGSRTMMGWMTLKNNNLYIIKNPEWFKESRRYIEYPEISRLQSHIKYIDFEKKFCIVRDPVERFLSAFTNRVLFHNRVSTLNQNVDFHEFMNTIDEKINTPEYKNFENHTKPLTFFLGKNSNFYDYIFNINEMDKVKKLIESIYNVSLPNLHLQKSGDIKKPVPTDVEIKWIKNRYKIDYEVYGKWF